MTNQVPSTITSGSFSTADSSEFELAVQPWDLLIDDHSQKYSSFELDYISFPGLTLTRERYGDDVRLMGMPPPGHLALAIPFGGHGTSEAYGDEIIDHQLYALAGEPLDVRYCGGQTVLTIEFDVSQDCEPSLALAVEKLVARGRRSAFSQSPETVRGAATRLRELLRHTRISQVSSIPGAADLVREIIEDSLVGAVMPVSEDHIEGKKRGQTAAVTAFLELLRQPKVEFASVASLCAAAGVNKRTLERGMRDKFDCTAQQVLQKWRVHAARQRLLEAEPQETTVAQVAMSLAFYDLGRFASRYRHRFGENPSETLRSASRTILRRK